ncbi:MAG: T9SS type A sorting domain-containing protein [Ignavibacteria bacterium]|nr:T9SS type A sorting domain-containing protein [Ignavibacteria bacterium]
MKNTFLISIFVFLLIENLYSQPVVSFSLANPRVSGSTFLYDLTATVLPGRVWRVGSCNIRIDFTSNVANALTVSSDNPVINANSNINNANGYQTMTTTSVANGTAIGLNILTFNQTNFYTFNPGTHTMGTLRWNIVASPFTNATMNFRVSPATFSSIIYDSLVSLQHTSGFTTNNPTLTNIGNLISGIPNEYILNQNYPNPFNPSTKISFGLVERSLVTFKVYDINGKMIELLINEIKEPGFHSIEFNAQKFNLSSGVYFYKIQTVRFTETKSMILIK